MSLAVEAGVTGASAPFSSRVEWVSASMRMTLGADVWKAAVCARAPMSPGPASETTAQMAMKRNRLWRKQSSGEGHGGQDVDPRGAKCTAPPLKSMQKADYSRRAWIVPSLAKGP